MNAGSVVTELRSLSGRMAYMRDKGLCMYCWHNNNKTVRGSETHHVFGRAKGKSLFLEHWDLRLTLCRECHYKIHHGTGLPKALVISALAAAVVSSFANELEDMMLMQARKNLIRTTYKSLEDVDLDDLTKIATRFLGKELRRIQWQGTSLNPK